MKKLLTLMLIFGLGLLSLANAQVLNYKLKTTANQSERTKILNAVRTRIARDYRQEVVFTPSKLNVSQGYAWFEGSASRKDGRQLVLDPMDDCCHVEALLKKTNGSWNIVEMEAFSTDVWYDGIWNRTKAPRAIFK